MPTSLLNPHPKSPILSCHLVLARINIFKRVFILSASLKFVYSLTQALYRIVWIKSESQLEFHITRSLVQMGCVMSKRYSFILLYADVRFVSMK